jgi:hypothetical protein
VKAALEAVVDDARREVAAAAVHVVEAMEEEVMQKKLRWVLCNPWVIPSAPPACLHTAG